MREIKFRAWDKKSKKMRQVTEIVFNTGFYLESDDNTVKLIWVKGQDIIENKEIQIQRQNDFELMQYTGLKDKNGKEIYEGDIVKTINKYGEDKENITIGVIEYEFNQFVVIDEDAESHVIHYGNDIYHCDECEVIGNIYDNPELLEKGE